jgi:hypothetical protein
MTICFTSVVLKILTFTILAALSKVAEGYSCYAKAPAHCCCFLPDGNDLILAVYKYNYFGVNTTAGQTYGTMMGDWCVYYVQDFSSLFKDLLNPFNKPLTNWNTSSALMMQEMFYATAFNQPVNFDMSRVTNMNSMFASATVFNQPVNFNTSKVNTT